MSRLGKSLKSKFLAIVLAGAMVMTSVASPEMLALASESADVETAEDMQTPSQTSDDSEEAAEDEEIKQKDTEEIEAEEQDNKEDKTDAESEAAAKKETTTTVEKAEDDKEIEETDESETDSEDSEEQQSDSVDNKANTSTYGETEGNSKDLVKYNMEGFASSYKVTGGGLLKPENDNYYKATTEKEFLDAILKVRDSKGKASVIEITEDMNLGDKELETELKKQGKSFSDYSRVIAQDGKTPLLHPTLKETGVSVLMLQDTENLTIFSKNGSMIKHCGIVIKRDKNLIIRNITFDELWEWDDGNSESKPGAYDRNDWDYMGIQDSDGIWIDHCTFYKAYDGIIDIKFSEKTTELYSNVTISWCRFLPGSKDDTFFDKMLDYLETNKESTTYYKELRDTDGFSKDQVRKYAYGQKKTHLIGQDDKYESAKNINLTLANNYYYDSMDRMPRVRFATAHEYNCVLDAQDLYDWRNGTVLSGKITSNGALSTCEGNVLLENCYIKGINNPLISGNSDSPMGSINAVDSLYYIGSTKKELAPKNNNSDTYIKNNHGGTRPDPLITDADAFRKALPYSDYIKYEASSLNTDDADSIKSLAGAGVLKNLSEVRWEKTSYGERDTTTNPSEPESSESPKDEESSENDGSDEVIKLELRMDELDTGELTADSKKNGFTLKAKSNNTFTVDGNNINQKVTGIKRMEGKTITKRLKSNGAGSVDSRSIHFTAETPGTLVVYAVSSNSSEDRDLCLYKKESTDVLKSTQKVLGSGPVALFYPIEEKGEYYVVPKKAINFYYIALSGSAENSETEGSSTPEGEDTKPSSTPEGGDTHPSSTPEGGDTKPSSTPEESKAEESSDTEGSSGASTDDVKYITETLKFRAKELKTGKLELEDLEVDDYFTVKMQSEIKTGNKTIDGETFTNNVKFSGKGDKDKNSIQIKALGKGTLTIYAESGDTSAERNVTLLNSEGKGLASAGVKTAAAVTMEIPEKGIYYISSGGSSIIIYGIDFEVTYKEGETFEEEPEVQPTPIVPPEGDIVYGANEGADDTKKKYNMEGYAASANVTGGGLLKEESEHYYKVANEKEFIETLSAIRTVTDKPNVIEITADLNLGYKELNKKYKDDGWNITSASGGTYSGIIRAYGESQAPLMHPTLKETGVSYIKLHDFHNLTIFSKNGATIKHAGVLVEGSSTNIIIRNLVFDELWEWDENTSGAYDRNDWDYMTIEDNAEGIWIDHCTFYKAYDGIIDLKKGKDYQRVTISWCEFLPGSKNNTFFNEQMTSLENDKDNTTYYKSLRATMSAEEVWWYAYGQKKTHLFGSSDSDVVDKAIRATLANNYYKNSMDRMPRLRYGKVHEYNCILDAQDLYTKKTSGNSGLSSHITSNGAISTCGGEMLLENCYIRGILHPLASGNGSSPTGYINAVESLYYMDRQLTELKPEKNGSGSGEIRITDAEQFKAALPYSDYITYDASKLFELVMPYAGAGKLDLTTVQWERTKYGDRTGNESSTTTTPTTSTEPKLPGEENSDTEESSSTESSDTEESSTPESSETDTSGSTTLTDIYIVGLKPSYPYTGAKIIPDIEVWDGSTLLSPDIDYKVSYKNNVNVGEAKVIVTGKGNYTGKSLEKSFNITKDDVKNPINLKGAKIEKIPDQPYEIVDGKGKPLHPDFTLTLKGEPSKTYVYDEKAGVYKAELTEEVGENGPEIIENLTISNNVNKGTATILIRGVDDKGKEISIKKTFKITAIDLSKAGEDEIKITPSLDTEYAVKGAVPKTLKVEYRYDKDANKWTELKNGRDYTVKYANNKKAGLDGTITITGKGNYAKKCTGSYPITQLDLSKVSVKAVTAYKGIQKKKVKATVVDRNGTALKASQYTIKIYGDIKTEDGKIVGIDEYADTDPLEKDKIYVQVEAKDPNIMGETRLEEFSVGIDISKANFKFVKGFSMQYTGNPVTLDEAIKKGKENVFESVTIKVKGESDPRSLEIDTHYKIVSYENNINKGTATAVIKGVGDYSGTKTIKFKITQKSVKDLKTQEELLALLNQAASILSIKQ